jgi:hypothetical protein
MIYYTLFIFFITSPLHYFYYQHIISVGYKDPIHAASAAIIYYITLPLRGNPLHIVCDIPADCLHFTITCRTH